MIEMQLNGTHSGEVLLSEDDQRFLGIDVHGRAPMDEGEGERRPSLPRVQ